jgi:hypothetical protein
MGDAQADAQVLQLRPTQVLRLRPRHYARLLLVQRRHSQRNTRQLK